MSAIVCISHLRWDFVWQRPQQIFSRLAKTNRVVFVEEPVASLEATELSLEVVPAQDAPNITVVRLIYPVKKHKWTGFGDHQAQPIYNELLQDYLKVEGFLENEGPLLWLYTPMALDFVNVIKHHWLVYDVMDQLAAFKGAPSGLLEREEQLLQQASLVFTGGVSLYQAKHPFNPHTYLFPSGVDAEHFEKAADPANFVKPADIAELASPLLGYYGVVDERMDLKLLQYLAEAHLDWNIVIAGPLAKISRTTLPVASNLHYLGMKSYAELPNYLAFFDVALIPFATSEATRYLSPTKTLEYMAAHKPIVATPIPDVIELFGQVVYVAYSPAEFVNKVEVALNLSAPASYRATEAELLGRYSWDNIVRQMAELCQLD